jgi:hypothetical protein
MPEIFQNRQKIFQIVKTKISKFDKLENFWYNKNIKEEECFKLWY